MKKILLTLLALLVSLPAYAGTITLQSYVSGNDVTIANLESDNNIIETVINGNIEGVNIKDGGIVSSDFSQAVSPIVRWDESFNDYTYSGMLPVTSADLTSDVSAGVSYVEGIRVEKDATSNVYTASKETFPYITSGGSYSYCEETLGVTACTSPPSNALLLAKVTTDSDNITAVDDQRTTSVQITTTTTNFPLNYRSGAFVSMDTTAIVHAEPGSLAIGSVVYTRTTDSTQRNLATAGDWIDGSKSTSADMIFIYAYNSAGTAWDIKFSEVDPDLTDTSDNTSGTKRYHLEDTIYYRAIGWLYQAADNTFVSHEISNLKDIGVPNMVVRLSTASDGVDDTSYGTDLTETAINFYTSGNMVSLRYSFNGSASGALDPSAILDDGSNIAVSERSSHCEGTDPSFIVLDYAELYPQGALAFKAQMKVTAGTNTVSKKVMIVQEH